MSEQAPTYGAPPHSTSCDPPQERGSQTYAAELVDLTLLVGWWLGVGQYAYTIRREPTRKWVVARRSRIHSKVTVVGDYPDWPAAMKAAKEHSDEAE